MNYRYQIFGSKDSQDVDIMLFVDKLRSIDENHTLIKEANAYFHNIHPLFKGRDINCNLGILKDGKLVDVFKGTYDECNNSLFYTYDNHQQYYENAIQSLYDRSIDSEFYTLKAVRVARFILSFFSREPELREDIKKALKGNLIERLQILAKIDFKKYKTFPKKKEKHEDIYKVLAFQFSQILGLRAGIEIYTKDKAKEYFKPFTNLIDRKHITDHDILILNNALELFIKMTYFDLANNKIKNIYE